MEIPVAPEIQEELHRQVDFGIYGYTIPDERYTQAVTGWFRRRHNWEIDPSWMVQSYGVVTAIGAATMAFTQLGEAVIVQSPVYYPFTGVPSRLGRTVLRNTLREENGVYEMDFDQLEELAARPEAKLMLLCSPHNPIGRVWNREELEKVAEICLRHDVLVFADEIHCDFVYPGHTHIPFATLSEEVANHCIIGTAASKSFNLAGLSTSNIIIPNEQLRKTFSKTLSANAGMFNNYFGLAATRAAYEKGAAWLDGLLEHIQGNYQYVKTFLAEHLPQTVVAPLEGTYLMWVDFSYLEFTPEARKQFMTQEAGLYLDEGEMFGDEGEGWERINLACPRKALEDAMHRLQAAVERLDDQE
jgi:putative C-S lyase